MEFSVLNESDLHKTLKTLYSVKTNGKSEVKKDGFIFDILTDENEIIEIQTKNLSKMYKKIEYAIKNKLKIKIVHPVIISTKIITFDQTKNTYTSRKSPKKGCIYDIFKELTKIYTFLLDKNFELDIVYINMIEERIKYKDPIQSKNNKRRYKKNWIKTNKKLDEIIKIETFNSKEKYIELLPQNLQNEFCAADLAKLLKDNKSIPSRISKNSHLIIWVFNKMNLISHSKKEGKTNYYKLND